MKVSVITPLYNASSFLHLTVQSVLAQSFTDWELILVDDCSSDNSVAIAESFAAKYSRIRVIRLTKKTGASVARNTGIEVAQGRYIAFLDSDDLWLPNKLEKQLQFMQEKDIAFSFSAYEKIDEAGNPLGSMGVPEKVSYRDLLKTCVIGCLTSMYDTQKLGKIYMLTNTKREDFATWLAILKKIDFAYGMNEILAQYRVYAHQTSAKKLQMAKENWKLYRDIEQLSFLKSCYYFIHYAVLGVLRNKFPRFARVFGVLK